MDFVGRQNVVPFGTVELISGTIYHSFMAKAARHLIAEFGKGKWQSMFLQNLSHNIRRCILDFWVGGNELVMRIFFFLFLACASLSVEQSNMTVHGRMIWNFDVQMTPVRCQSLQDVLKSKRTLSNFNYSYLSSHEI